MSKKEKTLVVLGIIFISFNLRAPITAVGSIIEMIQEQYGFSGFTSGFITTLPLIAFAVVSPFVARFSHKYGYGRTMLFGLLFIMSGELIRSYTNIAGLFIGTAFIGTGIAIGNVLIPSIIKTKFPNKLGLMTGIYTSCLCAFAAVGAGASIPIAKGLNLGWENALSSWFILAVITLLIWFPQLKKQQNKTVIIKNSTQVKSTSIWKSPIAWWVTLFMGIQSLIFYSLVAWLPTIIISKGMSDSFSGNMAFMYQVVSIPITLIIPVLCDKVKQQQGLVLFTCFLYLLGMTLFLFAQSSISILLAVILMGLGMGGGISLSIAFISLRSSNAKITSELSGMTQSAGYLLAAIGPIITGLIFDNMQTWTLPILIFCILIVLYAFCGYFAGRNIVIKERC